MKPPAKYHISLPQTHSSGYLETNTIPEIYADLALDELGPWYVNFIENIWNCIIVFVFGGVPEVSLSPNNLDLVSI